MMKGEGRRWKRGAREEKGGDGRVHDRVSLTIASIVCHLLNYLLSVINVQETSGRAPAAV